MGLTILSYTEAALKPLRAQVQILLTGLTDIRYLSYNQARQIAKPIFDELVLITAINHADELLACIDKKAKYMFARRIINPKMIRHFLEIDPHEKGLVVNYENDNSVMMISELNAMGLNLSLTPYNRKIGLDANETYDYAITPGYPMLVPKKISRVIDVGPRLLSILTIADIIHHFAGSIDYEDVLFSHYVSDFIDLSRATLLQSKENFRIRMQMESLISHFESGIILSDKDGEILFHNKAASDLLNRDSMIGKKLSGVLPKSVLGRATSFHKQQDKAVHISQILLDSDPEHTTRIFILKDIDTIQSVNKQYQLYEKNSQRYRAKHTFDDIVHKSEAVNSLIKKAHRFAQTNSSIVIQGESGTGKELFAQAIHNASGRAEGPFVAINCAALSETLLESELFGYEAGAFTGALKEGKSGLLEQAHIGTIFLDEIGDAPLSVQSKLLRALQEKEILRISGTKIIPIDVRIIAATNRNLKKLVSEGIFRHDLFYRLNVLPIYIPPLRERKEDVLVLLDYYIGIYAKRELLPFPHLPTEIRKLLIAHDWSGNVREIMNIAEYLINISILGNDISGELLKILESKPAYETDETSLHDVTTDKKNEYKRILQILLAHDDNRPPGRKQIATLLAEQGYSLSEQQVKTRLELMRKLQLIQTSQGRRTTITDKGHHLLSEHSV